MTNYNGRLYELLDQLSDSSAARGWLDCKSGSEDTHPRNDLVDIAKQAILRLAVQALEDIKEQLPTSEQLTTKYGYHMPEKMYGYKLGLHDAREAIDQFEQNLLKALEEL